MKKLIWLPLIILILLLVLFGLGLRIKDQHLIPSVLINKSAPSFKLPLLNQPKHYFTHQDLKHHVSLVNVWASWCITCRVEHPILMDIAASKQIKIYGIDYKDSKKDANAWLRNAGDPYIKVGFDAKGNAAINWGVYGTPESFIIDKQGIIRYKQIGPITHDLWVNKLLPLIQQLKSKT